MSSALQKSKKPKRGLGRGLSALISASPVPVQPEPDAVLVESEPLEHDDVKSAAATERPQPAEHGTSEKERVRYIDIQSIRNNPTQPRQEFAESEIEELAASIRELGILQPVLVRPVEGLDQAFEIVAGERRWRAAQRAGLSQLPVITRVLSDRETLEIAIVENVQRSALSPLEEAQAYQRLADEFSLSQKEIAQRVGKDRSSVANLIRLLKLPDQIQAFLKEGKITFGHAKAILTVREPAAQLSLANKVVQENLSVRALESIVSRVVVLDPQRKEPTSKKANRASSQNSAFPEVTDRMRETLGTKVIIRHHPSGRGKIEIDYFSEAELDRLMETICK